MTFTLTSGIWGWVQAECHQETETMQELNGEFNIKKSSSYDRRLYRWKGLEELPNEGQESFSCHWKWWLWHAGQWWRTLLGCLSHSWVTVSGKLRTVLQRTGRLWLVGCHAERLGCKGELGHWSSGEHFLFRNPVHSHVQLRVGQLCANVCTHGAARVCRERWAELGSGPTLS